MIKQSFADILPGFRKFLSNTLNSIYNNLYSQLSGKEERKQHLFDYPIFEKNVNKLIEGVNDGFGMSTKYGDPNFELLQNLRQSVVFFAANKTFVQASELADLLIKQDGTIRPFQEFKTAAEPLLGQYNGQWLKTEYDLAVRSSRAAKDFKEAEANKDLYPNLKYLPSVSVAPRDEHMKFYGIVRPIDDPFWSSHLPPSDYNCKCSFEPTNEPVDGDLPADMPVPAEPLSVNPARTGKVFDESHPYFQKVGNLDISQNEIIANNLLKLVENNTKLTTDTISNGVINMQISAEGFTGIVGKPNSQQIKKLLLINDPKSFKEAFRSSTFEGEKDGKSYYSFMLGEIQNFFVLTSDNFLLDITETF
jgi:Phage Mu protein F like protein